MAAAASNWAPARCSRPHVTEEYEKQSPFEAAKKFCRKMANGGILMPAPLYGGDTGITPTATVLPMQSVRTLSSSLRMLLPAPTGRSW